MSHTSTSAHAPSAGQAPPTGPSRLTGSAAPSAEATTEHGEIRLLVVRHGESRASAAGVMSGVRTCAGLTDLGREQAHRLAESLTREEDPPDAIVASPVPRARETAGLLATGLGLDLPLFDGGVREMDFGAADGLTVRQYAVRYGAFDLQGQPDRPFAPGGESWNQLCARVRETLERIAAHPPGRRVLVVCHAGVVVAASAVLTDSAPPEVFSDDSPAPTSVTEFARGTGADAPAPWRLLRYDDHRHLAETAPESVPAP
ncbi:histidine phosphatase family protein [Streptomyces sp. AJS327]|uniref:histidine phosphatase family protein n=1 Tax=Streptomyces sp. AJS327 TaxID=2545265 RepID=UPI0015DD9B4F|nr:histidine phosphatase family protein [Streptomyces sp. AJS327]MBA0052927.1 histidine phosphatase family protein [Streptomyces sp. AJS327]